MRNGGFTIVRILLVPATFAILAYAHADTPRELTTLRIIESETSEVTEADIAISPDGDISVFSMLGHHASDSQILFDSTRTGSNEIHVMHADGSDVRQVTNVRQKGVASRVPGWSPDRQQIVFQSNRDSNPELYAMDTDGGRVRRLTHTVEEEGGPAWSPDGKRIAYDRATRDAGGNYLSSHIWVINADGSGPQPLTSGKSRDWYPAWSPDGQRLTFASNRGGELGIPTRSA